MSGRADAAPTAAERGYYVHPAAIVETDQVGAGTRIWAFAHVLPGARIGQDTNVCDHCFVENDVVIGDGVTVKSGVYIWDGVRIEDGVHVGPCVAFTNDLYPRSRNPDWECRTTVLREGCSVGANATVLPGVEIGRYALVGAGSVVTRDVPDFALVLGNPARRRGWVCVCGTRLDVRDDRATCRCGRAYRLDGTSLQPAAA